MAKTALDQDSLVGQTLGHYRIVEGIGAGGMGVVYRAHDEHLDRDVAIKVLPHGLLADDSACQRFRKEAHAVSKLNHPNIATVHDFDSCDGIEYLAEELVPGVSLDQMLSSGPLNEKEIIHLGTQLCEGLTAAHGQGILHRDIKPGNLRVTPGAHLKILDFGLAKTVAMPGLSADEQATLSATQGVSGTLPYMSPEQLRNERLDTRSDIWSAGCVLYEMATGRRPFLGQGTAVVEEILHQVPPQPSKLNHKLSSGLETIIQKCLEKNPELRYGSTQEIAVDLRRLSDNARFVPAIRRRRASFYWAWPLALLIVLAVTGIAFRKIRPVQIRSLAVLPLENLSGDPAQDYYSDGITEAVITDLGQMSGPRVISRHSVMQFKGAKKPLPEIAHDLGVDAVVAGSVVRNAGRVRVTAQLVVLNPERHVWAGSYEEDAEDVIKVQRDVAQAVAREIRAQLNPLATQTHAASRVNPEAYELYLRGREQMNVFGGAALLSARDYFERALLLDPSFAPAQASLAMCYSQLGFLHTLPRDEAAQKAKQAALRALTLDDGLAEAHTAAAYARFLFDWDWRGPDAEFRRGIKLNPNSADAHLLYSLYLTFCGRFDEAIQENRVAIQLDPLSPLVNANLGWTYGMAKRPAEGIAFMRQLQQRNPRFPFIHLHLAFLYALQGNCIESIAESELAQDLDTAYNYAVCGEVDRAEKMLRQAELLVNQGTLDPMNPAWMNASLGRREEAFRWLTRAIDERSVQVVFIKVVPELDNIRSDSRFAEALRRAGAAE